MKFLKNIALATIFGVMAAASANAQIDLIGQNRAVVLCQPQTLRTDGASKGITNNWVDIHNAAGAAMIIAQCQTNSGVGALTLTVQTSADQTNITTLANCQIGVSNSIAYTNFYYGSANAPAATNWAIYPGTITTPTAATAGFSTQYLSPASTSSNGVVTVSSSFVSVIGINTDDAQRFIRTAWVASGANTNYDGIGAVMIYKNAQ